MNRRPRAACTLSRLVVVTAVLVVAAGAIVNPALPHHCGDGRLTDCVSNVKQLALACLQYNDDWDGRMPAASAPVVADGPDVLWPGRLAPYLCDERLFACREQPAQAGWLLDDGATDDRTWLLTAEAVPPGWPYSLPLACGYLMNRELSPGSVGVRLSEIVAPDGVFLFGDGVWPVGDGSAVERQRVLRAARHPVRGWPRRRGACASFVDGHAKWLEREALAELRYAPSVAAVDPSRGGQP